RRADQRRARPLQGGPLPALRASRPANRDHRRGDRRRHDSRQRDRRVAGESHARAPARAFPRDADPHRRRLAAVELVEITLKADDGAALGATVYGAGEQAVLVMPATGVPQSYYAKYAGYLAERGFSVLTFDYRGIGRSRNGPLRHSSARMRDWALL